jgi:hypothetical protein
VEALFSAGKSLPAKEKGCYLRGWEFRLTGVRGEVVRKRLA